MELSLNRNQLIALGAAGALVLAAGGYVIGRSTASSVGSTEAASSERTRRRRGARPRRLRGDDAERARAAGIVTERVQPGGLDAEILAQGMVAPTPEGEAVLTARADGAIVRINRRLGDYVRAGETVATMESREAAALVVRAQLGRGAAGAGPVDL